MERVRGPRALTRHRLVRLAVLAAIGYLVYRVLAAQPSEVQVVYHYGAAGQGLREACMRYLRHGEQLRRVRFHYGDEPPGHQPHRVRLPDGDYTVELDLTYAGAAPGGLGGALVGAAARSEGRQTVRILRPLLVRGSGSVGVHVAPAP